MKMMCEFAGECTVRRARLDGLGTHPKARGELGELVFTVKATSFGLAVSKPYGDNLPYDFIVQGGGGRLLRIQVKSAFQSARNGFQIAVTGKHPGGRRVYTADEIDFIAAFVVPCNVWYIIPVEALRQGTQVHLYPAGCRKGVGGWYEKYREAWPLLTTAPKHSRTSQTLTAPQGPIRSSPTAAAQPFLTFLRTRYQLPGARHRIHRFNYLAL